MELWLYRWEYVSMGIYDKVIHCISHFFSELKKNIAFLAPLVLGIGIAIIASSFGIDYLFETFPVQTNLLFIGLILGSFDLTIIEIQKQEILLATPIDKMNLTKRIQLERYRISMRVLFEKNKLVFKKWS